MKLYKLTDQDRYTRRNESGQTRWRPGKNYSAKGKGKSNTLCSAGAIHAYKNLKLGLLLNPIHARIHDPRAFVLDGDVVAEDWGKVGCKQVKCVKELKRIPKITSEIRSRFAIYCAQQVYKDEAWNKWACDWLSGKDRSADAARAAYAAYAADAANAARAAYAACAADDAAYAAARAADAAYAADAADAARAAYAADADAKHIDFIELANKAFKDEARRV